MTLQGLLSLAPWIALSVLGVVAAVALGAAWVLYRALRHERRAGARAAAQWAQARVEHDAAYAELQQRHQALAVAHAGAQAGLDAQRQAHQQQLQTWSQARKEFSDTFQALAARSLQANNQSFMALARAEFDKLRAQGRGDLSERQAAVDGLVGPIRESLDKVQARIADIEKARYEAYGQLTAQVKGLLTAQETLRAEANNLVKALRRPEVRGRWGEMQLRRVVEMAGMLNHCDFEEQVQLTNQDAKLRPDLVVRMPGGRTLVVDAKAPLNAYLDAVNADDGQRPALMQQHAQAVRAHIRGLSAKSYWHQLTPTPEFVVLFLPGENFFSGALEADPTLIEVGVNHQVMLATPTTLISLLRAVAHGWRQERLAEGAERVSALGKELYTRLRVFAEHMNAMGNHLGHAVEAYNQSVASLESRVLVSARRFTQLGVSTEKELTELNAITRTPRRTAASQNNNSAPS